MEALVFLTKKGGKATSSRMVAVGFERRHKHVLTLIDKLIIELNGQPKDGPSALGADFDVQYLFAQRTYKNEQQKEQREYVISERGFRLLAMRMSGPRALGFQVKFLEAFEHLQARVAELEKQVPPVEAAEEVARLVRYTLVPVQIEAVKNVAGALVGKSKEGFGIINHHRAVMKLLTGERPSMYVSHAIEQGLKVKGKSGRAVLRIQEPHKAATAAVIDDAIRMGKTLDQVRDARLAEALPAAFQTILSLGLKSADLVADQAA